jgi:hypothetical protein
VPGVGGFPSGILRVAGTSAESTCPRESSDVAAWGHRCGENRIARLMRAAGLQARPKRRRLPWDTGVREEQGIASNLLDRQFEASAGAEPAMGRGLYVHLDRRGLVVFCGRARLVLSPHCRLVDERTDDGAVGHRCAGHGDLGTGQARATDASLGPGKPNTPSSNSRDC